MNFMYSKRDNFPGQPAEHPYNIHAKILLTVNPQVVTLAFNYTGKIGLKNNPAFFYFVCSRNKKLPTILLTKATEIT